MAHANHMDAATRSVTGLSPMVPHPVPQRMLLACLRQAIADEHAAAERQLRLSDGALQ